MKKLAPVLGLLLLSSSVFAQSPETCTNSLLKDSYILVQNKKRNVGIKLSVTKDFLPALKKNARSAAFINKTSRRLFVASTVMLTGSSIALASGLETAQVGLLGYKGWSIRYAIAQGTHPAFAATGGIYNAAWLTLFPTLTTITTGASFLEDDINENSSREIKDYIASLKSQPTEEEMVRMTLALSPKDVKSIVEAFIENTINQPEAKLISESRKLIEKYSSKSNGLWGGNGADYTVALASTEQAKADMYQFQLNALSDLEKDLERVCKNQN